LPALFAVALPTVAAPPASAPARLAVTLPAPPIKVAQWVKGGPANMEKSGDTYTFKRGTIHVVEFWATWCQPCRESIPRLTELAHTYRGKVTFTGISVWEHDRQYLANVARYVQEMGPRMDYNVAADDKPDGGTTATTWLQAAEQDGIPTAFIVDKDGKIAWLGFPWYMDAPLAEVVAGTFDSAAFAKKQASDLVAIHAMKDKVQQATALAQQGKPQEAVAVLDTITGDLPQIRFTVGMTKFALLKTHDEAEAARYASAMADGPLKDFASLLNSFAREMVEDNSKWKHPDYDAAIHIAERAFETSKGLSDGILETLAMAHFRKGNLDKAVELLEKAVEMMKHDPDATAEARKAREELLVRFKKARNGA
jgi:thiol-disulfide isomerase/thioredoxin